MTKATRQGNKSRLSEPIRRLERLLQLAALLAGYLYLYVYQNVLNIEVPEINFETLLAMPVVALVVLPLIHYIIVSPDPLQRSASTRKPIRFFQAEFPSKYILNRCRRCREKASCGNYISPESQAHTRYWFNDFFHGAIEKKDPGAVRETFQRGYTCKLLYYLRWTCVIFLLLSLITILGHHVRLLVLRALRLDLTALQILYPAVCGAVIITIGALNKCDQDKPTGCWHAWREINKAHVSWLKTHDNVLVGVICGAGGGRKRFKAK